MNARSRRVVVHSQLVLPQQANALHKESAPTFLLTEAIVQIPATTSVLGFSSPPTLPPALHGVLLEVGAVDKLQMVFSLYIPIAIVTSGPLTEMSIWQMGHSQKNQPFSFSLQPSRLHLAGDGKVQGCAGPVLLGLWRAPLGYLQCVENTLGSGSGARTCCRARQGAVDAPSSAGP